MQSRQERDDKGDDMRATRTTLLTGGTGKTGSRVARRLQERGIPTRIGSRSGEPAFDWEDRTTWAGALHDVGSVYLSYYPDLAAPGAVLAVRAFLEVAIEQGVGRVVLLSGRGEEEAQAAERVVQESGLEWTVVRCSWFSQNFSESFLLEPLLGGEVALPSGDVPEPFVDVEDIAEVAAAALAEDGHVGTLYELTGPRLLTFADAVAEIAEATGREIRFVPVSVDEYAAALAEEKVPEEFASFIAYLFREVMDGRNTYLANGVERALGRPARDFSDYVRDAAASGVWNVDHERA